MIIRLTMCLYLAGAVYERVGYKDEGRLGLGELYGQFFKCVFP